MSVQVLYSVNLSYIYHHSALKPKDITGSQEQKPLHCTYTV